MKKIILILSAIISSSVFANQTVGLGIYAKKSIFNAKKQIRLIPVINLEYKNFNIRGSKIGYTIYKEPNFNIELSGDLLGGYNDFVLRKNELKNGFKNIKMRKINQMGGLSVNFKLNRDTVGDISYLIGNKGGKGELKINRIIKLNDRVTFMPGLSFNYYDSKFMNYYIGISENEVKNNIKIKKTYKGKDTTSAEINSTIELYITEQTSMSLFAGFEYFDKKIKKSDLVNRNNQYYAGVAFRYSF